MRAVTIALAAIPVIVGGVGLAVVASGIDPFDPLTPASEDIPIRPDIDSRAENTALSTADSPDPASGSGTPIDGRRPHLSVIDGRSNTYLPVPLPEFVSLLPTSTTELSPLPPVPVPPGDPGPAGDDSSSGSDDRGGTDGDSRTEGTRKNTDRGSSSTRTTDEAPNDAPAAAPDPEFAPEKLPNAGPEQKPAREPMPPLVGRPSAPSPWVPSDPEELPSSPGLDPPRVISDPRIDRDVAAMVVGDTRYSDGDRDAESVAHDAGEIYGDRGGDARPDRQTTDGPTGHAVTDGRPDRTVGGAEESDDSRPDAR